MIDFKNLKSFVELKRRKAELAAELKTVQAALDEGERKIIDQFIDSEVTSMKVDGVTLFVKNRTFASLVSREGESTDQRYERAADALVRAGLAQYVHRRLIAKSLNAWAREHEKDGLPEEFDGIIEVKKLPSIGTRNLGVKEEEEDD